MCCEPQVQETIGTIPTLGIGTIPTLGIRLQPYLDDIVVDLDAISIVRPP